MSEMTPNSTSRVFRVVPGVVAIAAILTLFNAARQPPDFHGDIKPQISLGTGFHGNLNIPMTVLNDMRAAA